MPTEHGMRNRAVNAVCGGARLPRRTDDSPVKVYDDGFEYKGEGGIVCRYTGRQCRHFVDETLMREDALKCRVSER
jgi:hypothetical protein